MGSGGKSRGKSLKLTRNCMKLKEVRSFWEISWEFKMFLNFFIGDGAVISGGP